MAADLQQQIERIRAKSLVLRDKYQALQLSYKQLRQENTDLQAQLMVRDAELEKLRLQVEYLTVASTVRHSEGDLAATRATIADLFREIDACIKDLHE